MLLIRFLLSAAFLATLVVSCVPANQSAKENSAAKLIVTPISYYTSDKAKELGTRYADNLAEMVSRLRANAVTKELRLPNNIESPGGIGFFTHSETYLPDERYLEVAVRLAEPITAEPNLKAKLDRLFPRFGLPLLAILLSDSDIYQDSRVAGYGMNLSWQTLARDLSASPDGIVIYTPKDKARQFVDKEISQEQFFEDLVIFVLQDDQWVRQRI